MLKAPELTPSLFHHAGLIQMNERVLFFHAGAQVGLNMALAGSQVGGTLTGPQIMLKALTLLWIYLQ